jgi:small neutral amino acid transporter SnatA (MarC family)
MRWALFPAGVLFLLALSGMAFTSASLGIFWPALMILGGLYLAYRTVRMPQRAEAVADTLVPTRSDTPSQSTALVQVEPLPHDLQPLERAVGREPLELAHKEAL